MDWKTEWRKLAWLLAGFLACFWLPVGHARVDVALLAALSLVRWYAQEHVLLCLVPALFIAGAIGVFVSQGAVMRYFGPKANKLLAYGVASVWPARLTRFSTPPRADPIAPRMSRI